MTVLGGGRPARRVPAASDTHDVSLSPDDVRTFEQVREEIVEQVEILRLTLDQAAQWAAHRPSDDVRFEAEAWIMATAMIARGDIVTTVRHLPARFAQHREHLVLEALERDF